MTKKPSYKDRRRCPASQKICYDTEEEILKAVRRFMMQHALLPETIAPGKTGILQYYTCRICRAFHLTSIKKEGRNRGRDRKARAERPKETYGK